VRISLSRQLNELTIRGISRARRTLPVAESSKAPWRRAKMAASAAGLVSRDTPSPYEGWLRTSEEEAMVGIQVGTAKDSAMVID